MTVKKPTSLAELKKRQKELKSLSDSRSKRSLPDGSNSFSESKRVKGRDKGFKPPKEELDYNGIREGNGKTLAYTNPFYKKDYSNQIPASPFEVLSKLEADTSGNHEDEGDLQEAEFSEGVVENSEDFVGGEITKIIDIDEEIEYEERSSDEEEGFESDIDPSLYVYKKSNPNMALEDSEKHSLRKMRNEKAKYANVDKKRFIGTKEASQTIAKLEPKIKESEKIFLGGKILSKTIEFRDGAMEWAIAEQVSMRFPTKTPNLEILADENSLLSESSLLGNKGQDSNHRDFFDSLITFQYEAKVDIREVDEAREEYIESLISLVHLQKANPKKYKTFYSLSGNLIVFATREEYTSELKLSKSGQSSIRKQIQTMVIVKTSNGLRKKLDSLVSDISNQDLGSGKYSGGSEDYCAGARNRETGCSPDRGQVSVQGLFTCPAKDQPLSSNSCAGNGWID
ncbi:hypothetical protein AYI68_g1994 [Smittium mucronatum]|uniref:Uncharacterized protein n=1 Tax=Smittium mucronatum TaxID=133383 RepID=A0A1R0H405_9FUNG|nr:hypothetical protein AYI68_g1994 [Smittium mucronatum]